jgi:hypothetical protein
MTAVAVLGTVSFFGFRAALHYGTHWSGPALSLDFWVCKYELGICIDVCLQLCD